MDTGADMQGPPVAENFAPTGDPGTTPAHSHRSTFVHVPHPHIARRKLEGPITRADVINVGTPLTRVNSRVALIITVAVGSMWCAYLFTVLALVSLPSAINSGNTLIIISWIAQTFLQLVLLPVIIVGQNIQGQTADKRAEQTYHDAEAILHEAQQIQQHLAMQDVRLEAQEQCLAQIIAALKLSSAAAPQGSASAAGD